MTANDRKDNTAIKIGGKDIDVIEEFCYLGSYVLSNLCKTKLVIAMHKL